MMMQEKLLPQNIEAEQGVLGSILLDPEAIVSVVDLLEEHDFYRNTHRRIYAAIKHLYEQHEPADLLTLSDELERRRELDEVGGLAYLSRLVNDVPTSGNIAWYAEIVRKHAMHRQLIHVAGQIAAHAYEGDPDALEKAEHLVFQVGMRKHVSDLEPIADILAACMDDIDYAQQHRDSLLGVPTGFRELDDLFDGLQRTDLILLGGRPGSGKTSMGMNIAAHAAKAGKHVAVFSLEMGKKQLGLRLLSMRTGIEMQRLKKGWIDGDEWDETVRAQQEIARTPLWIDDAAGSPLVTIRSKLQRLEMEHRCKIDLVVVDYLQLLGSPENTNHDNQVQKITEISQGLKRLAKDFDVPVLALAQLSRAVEQRASKIPQLSDLRDSGSLEQDADIVLFVYREDYYAEQEKRENYEPNHIANVIVAKYRNGPTPTYDLYFEETCMRFRSIAPAQMPVIEASRRYADESED